jgi:thymidylate kinase
MNSNKKKPRLIIIEGPAGVGKTTIQFLLQKTLKSKKIDVDILPEFSKNNLGQLIKNNCQYGQIKTDWLTGISGLMLFLAEKINKIEIASVDVEKIWICDRFTTSEFILGFKSISKKEDILFAQQTVKHVYEWYINKISKHSIFIFLDCNSDILKERLEKRIARKLTNPELICLNDEIQGYRQLAKTLKTTNTLVVNGDDSVNVISNKILKHIYSKC